MNKKERFQTINDSTLCHEPSFFAEIFSLRWFISLPTGKEKQIKGSWIDYEGSSFVSFTVDERGYVAVFVMPEEEFLDDVKRTALKEKIVAIYATLDEVFAEMDETVCAVVKERHNVEIRRDKV